MHSLTLPHSLTRTHSLPSLPLTHSLTEALWSQAAAAFSPQRADRVQYYSAAWQGSSSAVVPPSLPPLVSSQSVSQHASLKQFIRRSVVRSFGRSFVRPFVVRLPSFLPFVVRSFARCTFVVRSFVHRLFWFGLVWFGLVWWCRRRSSLLSFFLSCFLAFFRRSPFRRSLTVWFVVRPFVNRPVVNRPFVVHSPFGSSFALLTSLGPSPFRPSSSFESLSRRVGVVGKTPSVCDNRDSSCTTVNVHVRAGDFDRQHTPDAWQTGERNQLPSFIEPHRRLKSPSAVLAQSGGLVADLWSR